MISGGEKMAIFETVIKGIGKDADLFAEEKMMILFGEDAPENLTDYCYKIRLSKSFGDFTTQDKLYFDDQSYKITSIGSLVKKNLDELGHITIKFDGSIIPELPGTLYVEKKQMPKIFCGTKIIVI